MNTPKPGSAEEAAARRHVGEGPFTVTKRTATVVAVVDAGERDFCVVFTTDCVGGDLTAAKARATRIAEALNRV